MVFNQKTFAPDSIDNQMYRSVLLLGIETLEGAEMFYGKFEV